MTGMPSWGILLGHKLFEYRSKFAWRGWGLPVPVDLYAHSPSEVKQYKTWTGFAFSFAVFLVVSISCYYVIFEYCTLPYDLAQSSVLHDGTVQLEPSSVPRVPDFGVQVTFSNKSIVDISLYPGLVDIFFWQNFRLMDDGSGAICPGQQGGSCSKRVRLPSEKCRFLGENEKEAPILAFCPMWGVLEESIDDFGVLTNQFVRTNSRENAAVPTLQGNSNDPRYLFLEADVHVNLTAIRELGRAYELDLKDVYGGRIAYICAFSRDKLFGVGIRDDVVTRYKRWSQTFRIKEYMTSTIDIPLRIRNISLGNSIVDFDFLETEAADVVVGNVYQELEDAPFIPSIYVLQNITNQVPVKFDPDLQQYVNVIPPETLLLSKAFIHIDQTEDQIVMTPPSTIFDILGIVGGFLSLFSLLIGWPAMILNQFQYTQALNRAKRDGIIPEDYLEADGSVKVEKANEVVYQLTKRSRPAMDQGSDPDPQGQPPTIQVLQVGVA